VNIIMFGGPSSWDGAWYSRHQLTAGLAGRGHGVVIVEPAADWRSLLKHPTRLVRGPHLTRDSQGAFRYSAPGWLPEIYERKGLRGAIYRLRLRALQRKLRMEGVSPAIYYVWHPDHQAEVERLVGSPLVYHAYDRYDRYTDAEAGVRRRETSLIQRADLCVAASVELGHHLTSQGARRVIVLRHGVDVHLFHPGLEPQPELTAVPGPRLGLVASLSDAVDVAALLRIARERPNWSLVIVGGASFTSPQKARIFDALKAMRNVYHFGFRPRTEIPAWICGFDVTLTCYDLATWAPYNQPLKMYEYLACGVPVVSTDITAARELGDLVERVSEVTDWVPAIERVLAENDPAHVERRVAFARANSWEQRAAELEVELLGLSADSDRRSASYEADEIAHHDALK
jgi:glycosyltransferase involved in cell wall biosynthesis